LESSGGNRRHVGRSRIAALAAGAAVLALALPLAACGGGDSSPAAEEPAGAYEVKVLNADFPAKQRLGETTLLRLGVRNSGEEAVPGLTVTFTTGGEQGVNSSLPFGYRSPEPALAQPDRPIWVLAADYPKVDGSSKRAGAETSSPKTFDFGRLEPGETTEAVWKLIAVRTGDHVIRYRISAGLGGEATAETAAGEPVAGRLPAQIVSVPPDTVVTDNGQVVPAPKDPTAANR
jgi:hypothetical protein